MNTPDPDALMVALIVAPGTFSRNKFFALYQEQAMYQARRRAQMVRSLVKELTEPWPHGGEFTQRPAAVVEEERLAEGELQLTFSVPEMDYRRSAKLRPVEAAALRYSLHRSGHGPLTQEDRQLVESCLTKLALPLDVEPQDAADEQDAAENQDATEDQGAADD